MIWSRGALICWGENVTFEMPHRFLSLSDSCKGKEVPNSKGRKSVSSFFLFFSSLEWFWPPDKMLYFKRIFSGCKHWTEELPSLACCSKTLQHVVCLQGRNQDCRSTEVMSPLPPPYLSSRQVYFPVCRNVVSLSLLKHFFLSWCAEGKILVQQE